MEFSEYAMVQNILDGNEADFSLIFTEYKKLVFAVARKFLKDFYEIEDICQEVFLRIFQSLKRFNPEYRLSTWIVTITKNLCINKIKKHKFCTESREQLDQNGYIPKNMITPEKTVIDHEAIKLIRSVVMELPEEYRRPVILFYYEGLSYKELTQILHVPMSIVKNRLYRAKIILKRKLSAIPFNYYS